MIYRIHKQITIKATLEDAWQFFSDPKNLKLITPPYLNMVINCDLEKDIYQGMIITYKVHPILGIPLNWVTEITYVEKNRIFIDDQRYGPYRLWHHQHIFTPTEDGVVIEDLVNYILPFGILGIFAHKLFVAKQLDEIFSFREKFLSDHFGIVIH